MPRFYRVETDNGTGPYKGQTTIDKSAATVRHPSPHDDGIFRISWEYRFGFRTLAQYRAWFSTMEREMLAAEGFRLSVYTVPAEDIAHGGHQSMADLADATLTERRPLT